MGTFDQLCSTLQQNVAVDSNGNPITQFTLSSTGTVTGIETLVSFMCNALRLATSYGLTSTDVGGGIIGRTNGTAANTTTAATNATSGGSSNSTTYQLQTYEYEYATMPDETSAGYLGNSEPSSFLSGVRHFSNFVSSLSSHLSWIAPDSTEALREGLQNVGSKFDANAFDEAMQKKHQQQQP
jgi:hypothetical protein